MNKIFKLSMISAMISLNSLHAFEFNLDDFQRCYDEAVELFQEKQRIAEINEQKSETTVLEANSFQDKTENSFHHENDILEKNQNLTLTPENNQLETRNIVVALKTENENNDDNQEQIEDQDVEDEIPVEQYDCSIINDPNYDPITRKIIVNKTYEELNTCEKLFIMFFMRDYSFMKELCQTKIKNPEYQATGFCILNDLFSEQDVMDYFLYTYSKDFSPTQCSDKAIELIGKSGRNLLSARNDNYIEDIISHYQAKMMTFGDTNVFNQSANMFDTEFTVKSNDVTQVCLFNIIYHICQKLGDEDGLAMFKKHFAWFEPFDVEKYTVYFYGGKMYISPKQLTFGKTVENMSRYALLEYDYEAFKKNYKTKGKIISKTIQENTEI